MKLTRAIVAVFVTLFFTAAIALLAYDLRWPPGVAEGEVAKLPPQAASRTPQSASGTMEASTADISAGLKRYIDSYAKKSPDRKFHVRYRSKDLPLDLIKVHDDRLSSFGGSKYFACVDMKATDGKIYVIDFVMALRPGQLTVTETSVHKINGKPLYNWKEEKGGWKRVPVSYRRSGYAQLTC